MLRRDVAARRSLGIGGSYVAAIAGFSRWASPMSVWQEKVDGPADESTWPIERRRMLAAGTHAEPFIVREWATEVGYDLDRVLRVFGHENPNPLLREWSLDGHLLHLDQTLPLGPIVCN